MRGIYWKIYLTFVLTSVMATLVTLIYAVGFRQLSNETKNLIAPTEGYISAAELMLQRGGEPLLTEWLLTFEQHPSVNAYVFDSRGVNVVGGAVPEDVERYAFSPTEFNILVQPLNRSEILVKAPLVSLNGEYYLLVVEFLHPFAVLDAKSYIFLGLGVALLFFAGMGFLLSDYLSRPLRQLRNTAIAIAGGDLGARTEKSLRKRKDEIGDLGREFDEMADRVQTLLADQKRLLRDISHELRSPLARLQVATELARLENPRPEVGEHLDRIELETGRVNEQIGDILLLARLEVEQNPGDRKPVEIAAILEEVAEDACFEQQSDSLEIRRERECDSRVLADSKMLKSAFENLIRNAILHTSPGTRVEVTLTESDRGDCQVIVRDHGPGVPEEHLPNLTRPFYRAEQARERVPSDNNGGEHRGYGLGLAIAARIIRSHGGDILIENHLQGGLVICCTLPAFSH